MPLKATFTVTGLRHHDFQSSLDELYALAAGGGQRVTLSIEADNEAERDAVIVYAGSRCVGYVRSGGDRQRAEALIRSTGRGVVMGRLSGADSEHRLVTMEMTVPDGVAACLGDARLLEPQERPRSVFTGWTFDGELLRPDEAETRLHAMVANLLAVVEMEEEWADDTEQWLEYVEQNMWRDISCELSAQVGSLIALLSAGKSCRPLYGVKALRLLQAVDAMGSPEVRRLQVAQIVALAQSPQMEMLLLKWGERAQMMASKLPPVVADLFLSSGELLMGRLWYLHLPRLQVRAVKTLLAAMVRLRQDRGDEAVHEFFDYFIRMADKLDVTTIKDNILVLVKYNDDHGHCYEQELKRLYEKLGEKSQTKLHFDKLNDVHGNGQVNIGQM